MVFYLVLISLHVNNCSRLSLRKCWQALFHEANPECIAWVMFYAINFIYAMECIIYMMKSLLKSNNLRDEFCVEYKIQRDGFCVEL